MKKIIALAALAAISITASAANLITDGNFSDITQVGSNSWSIISQSTLTSDEGASGWRVSAAPSLSGPIAGLEVRDGVDGSAQGSSTRFIELDGNENDMISQTLATVYGQKYAITFYVADRPDVSSSFLQTSGGYGYQISSGLETFSSTSLGSFGTSWVKETIDFTALSSSTTFSIWAAGKSDSYGTSFDNFSAVAVPEPASLGLFAAGLAFLGLTARRRRQQ